MIRCLNDTHIARFARYSQSCAAVEDFGQSLLLLGLLFSLQFSRVSFAFQSLRSCRPSARANSRLFSFHANDVGKWRESLASCSEQSKRPSKPLRLRRFRANGTNEIGEGTRT